jgi:hypothetical protein
MTGDNNMKQLIKVTILGAALFLLATASTALAGSPGGPGGGPASPGGPGGGPGGVTGEVTAIGTNSMTVLKTDSTSVTVTTNVSTTVSVLTTGASGSLSDIEVGNQVEVRGRPNKTGGIIAEVILLLPDGDQLRGRVTAIDDETITLQAPGETPGTIVTTTIVTTSDTTFREDQDTASLSDVEVGQELRAFGTLQSDGSLTATLVLIQTPPAGGSGGPGGGPGSPGGRLGGRGGGPNAPSGKSGG